MNGARMTMMHIRRMDRGFCVLKETNCVFCKCSCLTAVTFKHRLFKSEFP